MSDSRLLLLSLSVVFSLVLPALAQVSADEEIFGPAVQTETGPGELDALTLPADPVEEPDTPASDITPPPIDTEVLPAAEDTEEISTLAPTQPTASPVVPNTSQPAPEPEPGADAALRLSPDELRALAKALAEHIEPQPAKTAAPSLTQTELTQRAIEFWGNRTGAVIPGPDGRVVHVFGESIPTLVCKPGQACLLELEPGEVVQDNVVQPDLVGWSVELRHRDIVPPQIYFAFKPLPEAPRKTNFFILTDQRVYTINLVKDLRYNTPILSFSYPDTQRREMAEKIEALKAAQKQKADAERAERAARTTRTGVSTTRGTVPADELDFDYRIMGTAPFKPLRVYNDGRRTYVDLPTNYRGDFPSVIGGRAESNRALNFRATKGGQQIVIDGVLGRFELQVGRKVIKIRRRS
ncbi:TrbG/VirB9 family P-type conjugative transfer protein [uncultured Ruegeria sp.]|uniref:TrbG/VirB9 family P-type conjugative transfer protein n=1 Tax=uncultured Ruegeria sp. TaxID=259304 RepID=UPI0026383495|nr:TrbG/VirB9 family P-type conjugative transfer protein [uncultured Ruegeria sp.]